MSAKYCRLGDRGSGSGVEHGDILAGTSQQDGPRDLFHGNAWRFPEPAFDVKMPSPPYDTFLAITLNRHSGLPGSNFGKGQADISVPSGMRFW